MSYSFRLRKKKSRPARLGRSSSFCCWSLVHSKLATCGTKFSNDFAHLCAVCVCVCSYNTPPPESKLANEMLGLVVCESLGPMNSSSRACLEFSWRCCWVDGWSCCFVEWCSWCCGWVGGRWYWCLWKKRWLEPVDWNCVVSSVLSDDEIFPMAFLDIKWAFVWWM